MARSSRIAASLAFATVAIALADAAPARAGDTAAAEALFREGKTLMEAKDYAAACPKLEASYHADEATGTLLAIAYCHEANEKLATAWSEYLEAAARSARENRPDREQGARARATALEPRLSKLVIRLSNEAAALPDLQVQRDGRPVASGAYGTAVPVDGGLHLVSASAEGRTPFTRELTIAKEGESIEVIVPGLTASGATPSGKPPPVTPPPPTTTTTEPPPAVPDGKKTSALALTGLVAAGAGLITIGIGSYFGLQASSKNSDSKADCDGNVCGPTGTQARRDALSAGNTSTALFIVGGVLAAGGVALFFIGRSSSVRAAVGPTAGALFVTHAF